MSVEGVKGTECYQLEGRIGVCSGGETPLDGKCFVGYWVPESEVESAMHVIVHAGRQGNVRAAHFARPDPGEI